jgi:putative ABC transport system ATP-binding protein
MENVDVPVLKNIDLKIKKGEIVAVIGPSGCGKSTLLHLIGCLDRATKGKILIEGRDVSKLSDDELAKIRGRVVGFVFQFFYLLPTLSSLKNILLPTNFSDINKIGIEKKAKNLLEMVGIGNRENHLPSQLSGGERQRVAIARAMINDPKIILADEPTGNLDSKSGIEIMNILLKLNKEKDVTLVIVTHDANIASHAERIIYLKDGEIVKEERK